MALGSSGRRYPNTSNRQKVPRVGTAAQRGRRTPITITGITITGGGTTVDVQFDQKVIVSGIPLYASDSETLPTGWSLTGGTLLQLTYAAATTNITVPFEEPHVRNGAGGYVLPGTFSPPE